MRWPFLLPGGVPDVCEHFECKQNAEIRHFHQHQKKEAVKMDEVQGLRSMKKRSIPDVCEHFECKQNAEIRHFHCLLRIGIKTYFPPQTTDFTKYIIYL